MFSLNSFMAYYDYFVGVWPVLVFFVLSLLYLFVYAGRRKMGDLLQPFVITGMILSFCLLGVPFFLGKSLNLWLQGSFFYQWRLFFFLFTFSIMMMTTFPQHMRLFILSLGRIIQKFFLKLFRALREKIKFYFHKVRAGKKEKSPEDLFTSAALRPRLKSQKHQQETKKEEHLTTEVEEEPLKDFSTAPEIVQEQEVVVDVKGKKKKPRIKKSQAPDFKQLILCLQDYSEQTKGPDDAYFQEMVEMLQSKLSEFKLDVKILDVLKGPVVDTFELELGPGVKVSKISGITEDLSLALRGLPLRIVYPLRGRTTIGLEVPRKKREVIALAPILRDKKAFDREKLKLPLAMGKNAFGDVSVVDLATMPHMLVAGATGAGKSVFINTLLVSLLLARSAKELRLILIDPKQLELALYADLPHLALPVVTEPQLAAVSLLWACQEMERRYSLMKALSVRNIEGFNKKILSCSEEKIDNIRSFYPEEIQAREDFHLPYIVIVIDEFADLILTKAGKDIETNVCRLAAKARASGIHLVLATQRPSVDVITGLIKSNFPTRVSFRVTSNIDSRTILNAVGAEKLLGKGDMLYKTGVETSRLHSAYVDEEEIERLMEILCVDEVEYDPSALSFLEKGEQGEDDFDPGQIILNDGDEELYQKALQVVTEMGAASASMLQRRLRVGYNRAATLIDLLEQRGAIGPSRGSKPREVLAKP